MTDAARPIRPLPELLEALRSHGLRRGVDPGPMVAANPLPTGHPGLDAALRSGGWPRGALALLDAPPGGGATSLALGSLAACQTNGGLVAWLQIDHGAARAPPPATAAPQSAQPPPRMGGAQSAGALASVLATMVEYCQQEEPR